MTVLHGTMTFRRLAERVKRDVDRDARKISDPEGDVEPTAYLYMPSAQTLHVHQLPRDWFSSVPARRRLVTDVVVPLVKIGRVTLVALQVTMYTSSVAFDDVSQADLEAMRETGRHPEGVPYPSEAPDRTEIVAAIVWDPEIREMWQREIVRRPGARPVFRPWQRAPYDGAGLVGPLMDPITEALR